jgi:hypothetical protein
MNLVRLKASWINMNIRNPIFGSALGIVCMLLVGCILGGKTESQPPPKYTFHPGYYYWMDGMIQFKFGEDSSFEYRRYGGGGLSANIGKVVPSLQYIGTWRVSVDRLQIKYSRVRTYIPNLNLSDPGTVTDSIFAYSEYGRGDSITFADEFSYQLLECEWDGATERNCTPRNYYKNDTQGGFKNPQGCLPICQTFWN